MFFKGYPLEAKLRENKTLAKWRNHSAFTDVGKFLYIMLQSRILNIAKMSFNVIRKNKILEL